MSVFRRWYGSRAEGRKLTRKWYVEFRDHRGVVRRMPGFTLKRASQALERQVQDLVATRCVGLPLDRAQRGWIESLPLDVRRRLLGYGLIQPADVASLQPIRESLTAWRTSLAGSRARARRVAEVVRQAEVVLESCGAVFWTDVTAEVVRDALVDLQQRRGWVDRTAQRHLQAIRQFCRWARRHRSMAEDPLVTLTSIGCGVRAERTRRALTAAELAGLLSATRRAPPVGSMSGRERAVVYRLASETGLRRGEIVQLTRGDFDVDEDSSALVRARWDTTKNGDAAVIPLMRTLARELRSHLADRLPAAPAFSMSRTWRSAETLRGDLARAGIPHTDLRGHVVDFHALRVTFATNLARAGVSIQVAQRLLRHSTPVLTCNVYTRLSRHDERRALERLSTLSERPVEQEAAG